MTKKSAHIVWLKDVGMNDVAIVGGKNASLGEMITHLVAAGVEVPSGFATTADFYRLFISHQQLHDKIQAELAKLDIENLEQLAKTGAQIRQWILDTPFPADFETEVGEYYYALTNNHADVAVAVRSSATAEDLPEASFAGQQETLLNVRGLPHVLLAIKQVFASLFNDRAITYRVHHGFDHDQVALSVGIQLMVRSDLAASGVMFSVDTESGFDQIVFITSSYGLGELLVQGSVNPDEFYVYKPNIAKKIPAILRRNLGSKVQKMVYDKTDGLENIVKTIPVDLQAQQQFSLNDTEITQLAEYAVKIEQHYGRPMDIEWAKDGKNNHLYILQARPETVQSRQNKRQIERYQLDQTSQIIVTGRSIGQKIGQGKARIVQRIQDMAQVQPGDVLVTDMTDPDWEPVMKRAAAIVTNRGGRTCHAAIIARELGIPAVVGCGDATQKIHSGAEITVSCAEGDTGYVYQGLLQFEKQNIDVLNTPKAPCKIMLNVGNPDKAFEFCQIPNDGVGLARLEFIINRMIGIHPNALLNYQNLSKALQQSLDPYIRCYADPVNFYIEKLVEGISTIAAAFYPKPVIVRLSDFKSNEYANLLGGKAYEPEEENPMLGLRGASRYLDPSFVDCFVLECKALSRVRLDMQLTNVEVMVPFVRTVNEAKQVVELLATHGLKRGENGLRIIMMCELPSNALLARDFLTYFDGFSIGSNDMTQLTLGLDRDSGQVSGLFDERDPAIKALLHLAIQACKQSGQYIGICGQGPSDHPDFAEWLVEEGIDSISLNPDTAIATALYLAALHKS